MSNFILVGGAFIIASALWLGIQIGAWAFGLRRGIISYRSARLLLVGVMVVVVFLILWTSGIRVLLGRDAGLVDFVVMPLTGVYFLSISILGLRIADRIVKNVRTQTHPDNPPNKSMESDG